MNTLTLKQVKLYKKLSTPTKVQDFINSIPANFELEGESCMSPLRVLENNTAHCLEGAMLAASILKFHGHKPLLLDLRARRPDQDHVVALFQVGSKKASRWGAISKTNHAVLRYREPVYTSVRELAMSYFHEYFDDNGKKNLREYSTPFNLNRLEHLGWEVASQDLWEVVEALDSAKHYKMLSSSQQQLRLAEKIEIEAGKLVEWNRGGKKLF